MEPSLTLASLVSKYLAWCCKHRSSRTTEWYEGHLAGFLSHMGAAGSIPAADFAGPDYGAALVQGAASPHWRAGGLRLHIPDLRNAFPETCCYQLELRVYTRGVVSCDHNYTPSKLSYYSLTVVV